MRILVVNCSPVRTGATAFIAEETARQLAEGNEVRSVCIDDYNISLCRGCRSCHETAKCFHTDDVNRLMEEFDRADKVICVSPSYWADVPGQFKVFIDRCTPWCNTHEPHAKLAAGKKGYTIALRTGPGVHECERIVSTIEHFYGHLEIESSGSLCLTCIENRDDAKNRTAEISAFCQEI